MFHINYRSILLSFPDMTTGRTDIGKQRISGPFKVGQQ